MKASGWKQPPSPRPRAGCGRGLSAPSPPTSPSPVGSGKWPALPAEPNSRTLGNWFPFSALAGSWVPSWSESGNRPLRGETQPTLHARTRVRPSGADRLAQLLAELPFALPETHSCLMIHRFCAFENPAVCLAAPFSYFQFS